MRFRRLQRCREAGVASKTGWFEKECGGGGAQGGGGGGGLLRTRGDSTGGAGFLTFRLGLPIRKKLSYHFPAPSPRPDWYIPLQNNKKGTTLRRRPLRETRMGIKKKDRFI